MTPMLKLTVESARRMWAIKPFKYPADIEREARRTRDAVWKYIAAFNEYNKSCTCVWSDTDITCPVHGKQTS